MNWCSRRLLAVLVLMGGATLFVLILLQGAVSARIIMVNDNGGADYERIQLAIDNATDGDVVRVWEGTYQGNITLNKAIDLLGNASDKVILDGTLEYHEDSNETKYAPHAIHVISDNVNISGFSIINSPRGIVIESNMIRISDNKYSTNNTYGIDIEGSSKITIENNEFLDCKGSAIRILDEMDILIETNHFFANGYGVNCLNVSDSVIKNNYFENHSMGVYLDYSEDIVIIKNDFFNNKAGVFTLDDHCKDITIDNNVYGGNRWDVRRYGRDDDENPLIDIFIATSTTIVAIMITATIIILVRSKRE